MITAITYLPAFMFFGLLVIVCMLLIYRHLMLRGQLLAAVGNFQSKALPTLGLPMLQMQAQQAVNIEDTPALANNNFFYKSPVACARIDTTGNILAANKALVNMLGESTESALVGTNHINNPYREAAAAIQLQVLIAQKKDVAFSDKWNVQHKGNVYVNENYIANFNADGNCIYFDVVIENTTEKIKAERSLEITQEKYNVIINQVPVGIYRIIATGEIIFANQSMATLLGYTTATDIMGAEAAVFLENPLEYRRFVLTHVRSNSKSFTFEYKIRRKDGTLIWVQDTAKIFYDTSNHVLFIDGIVEEITARKNAEHELHRLLTAINQISEGIVVTDTEARILYANPGFEKMTQRKSSDLIGRNMNIVNSGKHSKEFYKRIWSTILNGNNWSGIMNNKRSNGEIYEEHTVISPVKNEKGVIVNFVAVKRDITEERRLENQIRHAQKLQAIGTLAGGIAHDFNNILMGMQIYTEILLKKLKDHATEHDILEKIYAAQNRAKGLTRQILSFSRQSDDVKEPLYIHIVVKEALKLVQSTFPPTLKLNSHISDCGCILGNPTHIHQIIMNLCTNASVAMEGSGTLSVDLELVDVIEHADGTVENTGNSWIKLSVCDTGCGIEAKIKDRIFDPFFTTKMVGEGTGLGLATVHGIVKQYNGEIYFLSDIGLGTKFYIFLPGL